MDEFRVMSEAEVEAVHTASFRVLAETGIVLTHPEAREILSAAGASIQKRAGMLAAGVGGGTGFQSRHESQHPRQERYDKNTRRWLAALA